MRALTIGIRRTAEGELAAARLVARRAGVVEHRFVRIPELAEAGDMEGGPLTGGAVPPTYIPMKNAIYYSLAAAFAEETGARRIVGGHNKDDLGVFADTSEEFFAKLQAALRAGSPRLRTVMLVRPLKEKTKAEVVALSSRLGVPLELTWSCHRDGREQCGRCRGCLDRAAAFRAAGVTDPLT